MIVPSQGPEYWVGFAALSVLCSKGLCQSLDWARGQWGQAGRGRDGLVASVRPVAGAGMVQASATLVHSPACEAQGQSIQGWLNKKEEEASPSSDIQGCCASTPHR